MADSTTTASSKPKVLVADDEQVIANTLAIILNQAGFEARAVFSGEKAVESLDNFQPDMLISDVIMTGMTGIEAAIITRSKLPKCKILLFSGQALPRICLKRLAHRDMSSKFSPNRSIQRICWQSCAANQFLTQSKMRDVGPASVFYGRPGISLFLLNLRRTAAVPSPLWQVPPRTLSTPPGCA